MPNTANGVHLTGFLDNVEAHGSDEAKGVHYIATVKVQISASDIGVLGRLVDEKGCIELVAEPRSANIVVGA